MIMNISFKTLSEHCRHQSVIRQGRKICTFKNGQLALSYADWQECKQANCVLINQKHVEPIDDQIEGQLSLADYLGGLHG